MSKIVLIGGGNIGRGNTPYETKEIDEEIYRLDNNKNIVDKKITLNEEQEAAVADFKSGKRNADKAFTGFLMKATKGQANPQVAQQLLAQELQKLLD